MDNQNWEKGWLDEILNQAEQEVQGWPAWMREPELRYPLNRQGRERERATLSRNLFDNG